ncbi:hypothetical protein HII31_05779 [Pseudocercospora fuligena]|uniref:Uncharacterized protein n=1 Tax=Pseudocercospora fuligena TaxID=685502 RepID=A0A8H6VII0_9PEZI|nr:hypothetical protein HII31_05779 [Pseudocercospora fuligena]
MADTTIDNMRDSSPHATTEPILKVDFSWKKFKTRISDATTDEQVYVVDCHLKKPYLEYKYADSGERFGIGNIHTFKIHADAEVNGQAIQIRANKRWITEYTHLSHAYPSATGEPVTLKWKTSWSLKNWDFICLGPDQEPIARFSSNIWAVTKVGKFEFMGTPSKALKEEILVTGFTLFYCMLYRANSLPAFFGAFFASTGPVKEKQQQETELQSMSVSADKAKVA